MSHATDCPAATDEAPICTCGALLRGVLDWDGRTDWAPEEHPRPAAPPRPDFNRAEQGVEGSWRQVLAGLGL